MIVGNLIIEMAMNVARLQTDVEKANSLIGNHVKNVEKSIRQVQSLFGSLGIGLSLAGLTASIKSSIDFADRLNDLSKVTNLTVRELAGLDLASRQSGTDLESTARAVDKLSVNMGKNAKEFAALGINSTDKLAAFKQFAEVFNQIADVHLRDAVASAAFGKEWRTIAPLLAEGGKKIEETIEKGQRLSGITEENVRMADELNDKLDELATSYKGLGLAIGMEIIPGLIKLNYWFTVIGIDAIEMTEKISLAWQLISTPSAWVNEKELADLEARFKLVGKAADEAMAMAKAESQLGTGTGTGTGPSSAGRKPLGSGDIPGFFSPDAEERAKQEKITQDALTQIKVDAFNQRIADRDAFNNAETQIYVDEFNAKIEQSQAMEDALTQIKVDAFNKRMELQNSSNAELAQLAFEGEMSQVQFMQLGTVQKVGAMASGLGQILQMAGGHSKQMFELSKKFALVDAAISMYQGIAKGVALGWPMGIPAVAWATAVGIAQIQKIQAQQFGGGVSGGGGGVGAPSGIYGTQAEQTVGVIPTQKQTTSVTINLGDGLYSANTIRDLFDKFNDAIRDGAVLGNITVSS